MTQDTEDVVARVAKAIWHAQWEEPWPREGGIDHAHALNVARAAIEALQPERQSLSDRIDVLEAEVERLTPRYAQPCFDHEYITPGCPDCGKMV